MPTTLYRYIGRQFIIWFSGVMVLVMMLVFVGNFVELTRRAVTHAEISFGVFVELAALQLPRTTEDLLPFVILIGSLLTLWRLTRTQELVVARAAGVSVWQFLAPAIALAFAIGVIAVTVFNPLAAVAESSFKRLETRLLRTGADDMTVSTTGIWLRQKVGDDDQAVVHAERMSHPGVVLTDVTIFVFSAHNTLLRRIDAATATLDEGVWRLSDVYEWRLETARSEHEDQAAFPTNLTAPRIEESFAVPQSLSFWALPGYIALLDESGFSTQKHKLYFQSLLARPFLLCAMVLIAATFSLRLQRRGGTPLLLVAGVASGFLVWFLSDVVGALGTSAAIPATLAAWTPAGISGLLGTTFLLHLEDG